MKGKMKKALKVHLIQPIKCTVIKTRFSLIIMLVFNAKKEARFSARGQNTSAVSIITFGGVMLYRRQLLRDKNTEHLGKSYISFIL